VGAEEAAAEVVAAVAVHPQVEVEAVEVEAAEALPLPQLQAPHREHHSTRSSWINTTSSGACMACHL